MPIDPMMLDATLNTFRGMAKEIESKGLTGEAVDNMNAALARMEQLGRELDDFMDYNGRVMNENLYGNFSDNYGRALIAEAKAAQEAKGYDDATLLKQSVDALKQAIKAIEDGKKDAMAESDKVKSKEGYAMMKSHFRNDPKMSKLLGNIEGAVDKTQAEQEANLDKYSNAHEINIDFQTEVYTKSIQDLINLGEEPGMTLPRFLKIQIEKGMDKAMEGSQAQLTAIELELEYAKVQAISPYIIQQKEEELALYKHMSAEAPYGVPNSKKYGYLRRKIEHKYEPIHNRWDQMIRRWESILDTLEYWVIAGSSVYPAYAPWSFIPDWKEQKEVAEYYKDCFPGFLKVKEKNLQEYFGMSFRDIFTHETFIWKVNNNYIGYSQEFLEFLVGPVYEKCIPLSHPSSDLIMTFENNFHHPRKMSDPQSHLPGERFRDFYDQRYGQGRYEMKYSKIANNGSNAAPWNLKTFKY
ncbi:MAG: hypothetical protein H6599_05435 [Flavobacteriales bacterium]|nr:hypothetical protein [Flavobacteriales bacterium]